MKKETNSIQTSLLLTALQEVGIKGVAGKEHNPEVLKYFKVAGFSGIKDDETAWCAAFANFLLVSNGLPSTGKLTARSFLTVGEEVKEPLLGDFVVFWRVSKHSWQGHVGLFLRETSKLVYVLGGNQSNSVTISAYSKDRLLQYRRIKG